MPAWFMLESEGRQVFVNLDCVAAIANEEGRAVAITIQGVRLDLAVPFVAVVADLSGDDDSQK